MDNQDKIKFKNAESEGWYFKIFLNDEGAEESRTGSFADGKGSGTGLYNEMMKWVDGGNEVEPQYTAEELSIKESEDLQNVLETQVAECVKLLKDTDYMLLEDFEYQNDVAGIKLLRLEWKRIIKSDQIEEIPEKTFQ